MFASQQPARKLQFYKKPYKTRTPDPTARSIRVSAQETDQFLFRSRKVSQYCQISSCKRESLTK